MRLFLINLARDRDRLAAAHRQLTRLGLPYERAAPSRRPPFAAPSAAGAGGAPTVAP